MTTGFALALALFWFNFLLVFIFLLEGKKTSLIMPTSSVAYSL
jgi:hypothetical protein